MTRGGAGLWLTVALSLAAGPAAAQNAERRQQDEILAAAGGPYRGPQADMVAEVGERMAAAAGLGGRCEFTLVDSDVVNAFAAPPGCHIYVTRGLLAVINSEAELAAVMGHEVGHVAARHAQRQRNQEVVTGLAALAVGAIAKSDVVGKVAKRAATLSNLGYSRSQEYEADRLSLQYLPQAGYPADGLAVVLDDLQREDQFSARGGQGGAALPVWASTHPLTSDRIRRVRQQAPPGEAEPGDDGRFLAALDGLAYGSSADQGVISGRTFIHPRLRIAFEAPQGFQLSDQAEGVLIQGPGQLRGEFAAGRAAPTRLEDYAQQVLGNVAGRTPVEVGRATRTRINGVDAVVLPARASTRSGAVEVVVAAYAVGGDRAYHFVTISPAGQSAVFDAMYGSFRRLTEREAAGLGPLRITVVTVKPGDTVESLAGRMAGADGLERFRMLNALQPGERLPPGRRVKLVTAGMSPAFGP